MSAQRELERLRSDIKQIRNFDDLVAWTHKLNKNLGDPANVVSPTTSTMIIATTSGGELLSYYATGELCLFRPNVCVDVHKLVSPELAANCIRDWLFELMVSRFLAASEPGREISQTASPAVKAAKFDSVAIEINRNEAGITLRAFGYAAGGDCEPVGDPEDYHDDDHGLAQALSSAWALADLYRETSVSRRASVYVDGNEVVRHRNDVYLRRLRELALQQPLGRDNVQIDTLTSDDISEGDDGSWVRAWILVPTDQLPTGADV